MYREIQICIQLNREGSLPQVDEVLNIYLLCKQAMKALIGKCQYLGMKFKHFFHYKYSFEIN